MVFITYKSSGLVFYEEGDDNVEIRGDTYYLEPEDRSCIGAIARVKAVVEEWEEAGIYS